MSVKDDLNKAVDGVKSATSKAVENVKDAANEVIHRGAADDERAKRETLGDQMSTGDKMKSHLNEAKENTQAEIDHTKREVRTNI
jgi:hypothetical protein